jgi:uncharacterized protein
MPYFVLFYDTVENFVERRMPHREAHLALVNAAHRDGSLVLAGALKPADGALLVFRTDDIGAVEAFARHDPYVTNGLVRDWRIREWAVVVGQGA